MSTGAEQRHPQPFLFSSDTCKMPSLSQAKQLRDACCLCLSSQSPIEIKNISVSWPLLQVQKRRFVYTWILPGVCVWSGGWGWVTHGFTEHLSAAPVARGLRCPCASCAAGTSHANVIRACLSCTCQPADAVPSTAQYLCHQDRPTAATAGSRLTTSVSFWLVLF